MSKFGVLVMGPAGAGKTTFCSALIQHLKNNRRSCFYVNLDPAAETFEYEPDLDIKDLITLEDAMDEVGLGPNGGLIYCFEFLLENLSFLTDALAPLSEESLIILDLPGQIELYTHIPLLPNLIRHLSRSGAVHMNLCALYLLEATFVVDRAKFFAGTLSAMSAMIMLEVPHLNVLSKMDLVRGTMRRRQLKRFLDPDTSLLDDEDGPSSSILATPRSTAGATDQDGPASFSRLNHAVARLIDDFSMVSYLTLSARDEESVGAVLSYIDDAIQFHEAQEPREPREVEMDE
ncbi:MAG: ATP binding protein [Caeruleum heppii]|nr:MAG: ATP binding protein [Caeruleum heppii]